MKNFNYKRLLVRVFIILTIFYIGSAQSFWKPFLKNSNEVSAQTCVPIPSPPIIVPGPYQMESSVNCPAGTFVTGGGCNCDNNDAQIAKSYPNGNGWYCDCEDTESDGNRNGTPYAICMRF